APSLLAQIAPRREGEEWLDRRARVGEEPLALLPVCFRSRRGTRSQVVGESGEVRLAFENHRQVLLVGELILAEGGEQRRQPLVDRREPRLLLRVEICAPACKPRVVDVGQALLFGRQPRTP